MCPASVSGIVTGDKPVSYWPIFPVSLVTAPEAFAKVNSAQFPSLFKSGEWVIVSFAAAFRLVTYRSSPQALHDEPKNGCEAD